MKPGALIINCGRGGVVDEEALLAALDSGHLAGAGLDVYAEEPPTDSGSCGIASVVATPHIGAQTREAQERISTETAEMLLAALAGSLAVTAVNLPFRPSGEPGGALSGPRREAGANGRALLGAAPQRLGVELGDRGGLRVPYVAVLKGVLSTFLGTAVNYVNAERIAESRGIEVVRATHSGRSDYPQLVGVGL